MAPEYPINSNDLTEDQILDVKASWLDPDTDIEGGEHNMAGVFERLSRLSLFSVSDYTLDLSTDFDDDFDEFNGAGEVADMSVKDLIVKYHWIGDVGIVENLFEIPSDLDTAAQKILVEDRKRMAEIIHNAHTPLSTSKISQTASTRSQELLQLHARLSYVITTYHWVGDVGILQRLFDEGVVEGGEKVLVADRRRMLGLLEVYHPILTVTHLAEEEVNDDDTLDYLIEEERTKHGVDTQQLVHLNLLITDIIASYHWIGDITVLSKIFTLGKEEDGLLGDRLRMLDVLRPSHPYININSDLYDPDTLLTNMIIKHHWVGETKVAEKLFDLSVAYAWDANAESYSLVHDRERMLQVLKSYHPLLELENPYEALRDANARLVELVEKYHWIGDTTVLHQIFDFRHNQDTEHILLSDRKRMLEALTAVHPLVAVNSHLYDVDVLLVKVIGMYHWIGDVELVEQLFDLEFVEDSEGADVEVVLADRRRMVRILLAYHDGLKSATSTDAMNIDYETLPSVSNDEQQVIDDHLRLSYHYEEAFRAQQVIDDHLQLSYDYEKVFRAQQVVDEHLQLSYDYEKAFREQETQQQPSDQQVVDEHLRLSYEYEATFRAQEVVDDHLKLSYDYETAFRAQEVVDDHLQLSYDYEKAFRAQQVVDDHLALSYEYEAAARVQEAKEEGQKDVDDHLRLSYEYEKAFRKQTQDGTIYSRDLARSVADTRQSLFDDKHVQETLRDSTDQNTIDEHLKLSYVYEKSFLAALAKTEGTSRSIRVSEKIASTTEGTHDLKFLEHLVQRVEGAADLLDSQESRQTLVNKLKGLVERLESVGVQPRAAEERRTGDSQEVVDNHLAMSYRLEAEWWKKMASAQPMAEQRTISVRVIPQTTDDRSRSYWESYATSIKSNVPDDKEALVEDVHTDPEQWAAELDRLKTLARHLRSTPSSERVRLLNTYLEGQVGEASVDVLRGEIKDAVKRMGDVDADWLDGLISTWEEGVREFEEEETIPDTGFSSPVTERERLPTPSIDFETLQTRIQTLEATLSKTQSALSQITIDHQLLLSYSNDLTAAVLPLRPSSPESNHSHQTQLQHFTHNLTHLLSLAHRYTSLQQTLHDTEARLRARDTYLRTTVLDSARQVQSLEQRVSDLTSENEDLKQDLKLEQRGKRSLERELLQMDEGLRDCGCGFRRSGRTSRTGSFASVSSTKDDGHDGVEPRRRPSRTGSFTSLLHSKLDDLQDSDVIIHDVPDDAIETRSNIDSLKAETFALKYALNQLKTQNQSLSSRLESLEQDRERRVKEEMRFVGEERSKDEKKLATKQSPISPVGKSPKVRMSFPQTRNPFHIDQE
ncbi:uncharacterized protein SPPG_05151 [Spizellomyces punctatus DAOM BR117]|uniref:Uncharacterized protein n=1 Tax=Spizellomyces punctatus (strain DAOM BR117) TaxID=645134 RepID=A0A0L0HG42_SPIPD|nr:uncharacterized protein SPPG_05151 [Spizellomyces punctatus DAOM BR117]KNC99773.1 hypothetical protein SPPG_05151 [Spizellomyces punctatus DAOM BR117]|eukprot:XP_016607813.1 hypothetical protein SPPG_05151 [Spizellomyces punctatus DAOM BR117]